MYYKESYFTLYIIISRSGIINIHGVFHDSIKNFHLNHLNFFQNIRFISIKNIILNEQSPRKILQIYHFVSF